MKKILFLGDDQSADSTLSDLTSSDDYKILKAKSADQAIKMLKKFSPDFVLCAGKIQQNSDGTYFIEI